MATRLRRLTVLISSLLLIAGCQSGAGHPRGSAVTHVAFGSCIRQDRPAPLLDAIANRRPQLFILAGDNIYADTKDMDVMKAKYAALGDMPGYRRIKSTCPILATWDDHDYGENDAGTEYAQKVESQRLFMEFFDEPADSPRRQRAGVYHAHTFGPSGKRLQVILLDTRYFRTPLNGVPKSQRKPGEGPYRPDASADANMLGEEQWRWLEQQLREPAELRLIVSSIQVIPTEHNWEYWYNFPQQRQRLFTMIRDTGAKGVVFLSGDRHLAELSYLPADAADNKAGYPLFDLTSSSINQPSGGNENEVNRYRVGSNYRAVNFGEILIDWDGVEPTMELRISDVSGEPVLRHRMRLADLTTAK